VIEIQGLKEYKIPEGIENGMRLRLAGEGEAGERGTQSGDLYVLIHVQQHEVFSRDGEDIRLSKGMSFSVAALGGEIEVPTLNGKASLKIPAGTQSGTVLRLKGKGLPSIRGRGYGDQNVEVYVEVPEKLSKKQKELIKEFSKVKKGLFGK